MIRPATLADVPAIVAMSEKFYASTSYREWSNFCPGSVANLATALLQDHVMLVADVSGKVVGMVGLFVAPFMFNNARTGAHEVVWWVEPDAQGAGVGKALLAAIEPACKARGADAIQMVHLASSPPQAAAIYERLGYQHTESSFTKIAA